MRGRLLEEVLNSLDSFVPRPYSHLHSGVYYEPIYERIRLSFLFVPRCRDVAFTVWSPPIVLSLLSGSIPAFKETAEGGSSWDCEIYNPQRVLMQFGMAQYVPPRAISLTLAETNHRFLTHHIRDHSYPVTSLRPCDAPILTTTPSFMRYWAKLQSLLREARASSRPDFIPPLIPANDLTLQGKEVVVKFPL